MTTGIVYASDFSADLHKDFSLVENSITNFCEREVFMQVCGKITSVNNASGHIHSLAQSAMDRWILSVSFFIYLIDPLVKDSKFLVAICPLAHSDEDNYPQF
jgi:hypothetical protein